MIKLLAKAANRIVQNSDSLISYVKNQRSREVIVLSSDDETDVQQEPKQEKLEPFQGFSSIDPIPLSDDETTRLSESSPLQDNSDSLSDLSFYLSPEESVTEWFEMDPPSRVKTIKTVEPIELLRQVEVYLQSIEPAVRRTRPEQEAIGLPYLPCQVWSHVTWEDWSQLQPGDIVHWPFRPDEVQILMSIATGIKRKIRDEIDLWYSISCLLPGRSPDDCKTFWMDFLQGEDEGFNRVMMVRHLEGTVDKKKSRFQLVSERRNLGKRNLNAFKKLLWKNMSRENRISGGSGDAIALAIFNEPKKGIKVAVGSLCDENIQYNMPGNLRLWTSEEDSHIELEGHQSKDPVTGQSIWRTVTDVKMSKDRKFIYSCSHDGSANVWRARTGRLVSTLRYHNLPINQLAVNYAAHENVLATCSNDGTATVWRIGQNGKTGSGVVCELDSEFYNEPHVECIEFGYGATDQLLFLGINNNNYKRPGYVEGYDTETGQPKVRFSSMKGCVSALAVSKSGRWIVSGNYNRFENMTGDRFIHLHDSRINKTASKFHSGHPDVNVVAISPCERFVASGNADKEKSEVALFDVRYSKRRLHTLSHDQSLVDQSLIAPDSSIGIGGLYWSHDSRTVITGGGDSTIKIWNLEGETHLLHSYPTSNCVTSLAVDEDTMTIAAGVSGAQGIVHVWQP